ncbi:MAG: TldD/PmbA family protein [Maricaulaceae bacterium]
MGKPSAIAADTPIRAEDLEAVLDTLLTRAKHYGADNADAIATHGRSLSVAVREGALEDVDNSEGKDIGLRVMIGQRSASVSSSDLSDMSIDMLAERAVAMARLAPEDPYMGLAPTELLQTNSDHGLELFDGSTTTPAKLKSRALELEAATLGVKSVAQAEGCNASWSTSAVYFKTSHGFGGGWRSSRHGISAMALASDENGAMERDYDYDGARWLGDIKSPAEIGRSAGERVIRRLGAKQLASGSLPVIFERRVAGSLISAFMGAINGAAIARGTSFLKDAMGTQIFKAGTTITDDPYMVRGHGSRPWDGEGVAGVKRNLIEDGKLTTWLLNTSAAKQLDLTTTGHAVRGIAGAPGISTTNAFLSPGTQSPAELCAEMGSGLWITEMFGPSLNANTGDYSVGVAGFNVENGVMTHPVSEVTIAGNLKEMFASLTPANDLEFDGSTVAPTVRVEGLTLAGT